MAFPYCQVWILLVISVYIYIYMLPLYMCLLTHTHTHIYCYLSYVCALWIRYIYDDSHTGHVKPAQNNESALAPTKNGYFRMDYDKDQRHHLSRAFKELKILCGKKMSAPRMVAANRTIQGHHGVGPSSERATERHLNWNHCVKQHVMDS